MDLKVKNEKGEDMADCSGDVCDLYYNLKNNFHFEKGTYDSAKNACLTLRELEHYIVYWIVNVYHKSKHSILEIPPQQMWEEGIWGTKFHLKT